MKLIHFFSINAITSFADKAGSGDHMPLDYWLKKEATTSFMPVRTTRLQHSTPSRFTVNKTPTYDWESKWICGDGRVIPITKIIGKKRKLSQYSFTQKMFKACDYSLSRAQCFETRFGSY